MQMTARPPPLLIVAVGLYLYLASKCIWLLVVPIPLVFFIYFTKNNPCTKSHVDPFFNGFKIGGHRGAPKAFPENSMAGFRQAKRDGADLIEFDVALTKDGAAVILHDDDLDRTTNLSGPIRDHTMADIADANIAEHFERSIESTEAVEKEGLPTLEQTVRWAVDNEIRMLFDVKDTDAALVNTVAELFEKYNLYDKAIVCSFFPSVVWRIKQGNQKIIAGLTWRQKFFSFHDLENQRPRYTGIQQIAYELLDIIHVAMLKTVTPWYLGADLLLTNNLDISHTFVNEQRAWNRHVAVWTVNDLSELKWMVDTLKVPVLTDYPSNIKKVLEKTF